MLYIRVEEGTLKGKPYTLKLPPNDNGINISKLTGGGFIINEVNPGSIAEHKGVKPGHRIINIDGVDITTSKTYHKTDIEAEWVFQDWEPWNTPASNMMVTCTACGKINGSDTWVYLQLPNQIGNKASEMSWIDLVNHINTIDNEVRVNVKVYDILSKETKTAYIIYKGDKPPTPSFKPLDQSPPAYC